MIQEWGWTYGSVEIDPRIGGAIVYARVHCSAKEPPAISAALSSAPSDKLEISSIYAQQS